MLENFMEVVDNRTEILHMEVVAQKLWAAAYLSVTMLARVKVIMGLNVTVQVRAIYILDSV